MKILHNNRCSKSRCAVDLLVQKGVDFEVIHYLDNPLSEEEIRNLLKKLGIKAEALIRKSEATYKTIYKGKKMTENAWIKAMVKFPILIERPIIIKDHNAVIGRPIDNIELLF